MSNDPTCTMCGSSNLVSRGHKLWLCNGCNQLTDCVDDGDISYKPAERQVANKEEYELRKAARERRRRR